MTVSQAHSFTGAARLLGITQPAVSQNIAELEKQTGVQLFVRMHGEVALTEEGKAFELFADRILHAYSDLNAVFTDFDAYKSAIEKAREVRENPLYPFLKDNILA